MARCPYEEDGLQCKWEEGHSPDAHWLALPDDQMCPEIEPRSRIRCWLSLNHEEKFHRNQFLRWGGK